MFGRDAAQGCCGIWSIFLAFSLLSWSCNAPRPSDPTVSAPTDTATHEGAASTDAARAMRIASVALSTATEHVSTAVESGATDATITAVRRHSLVAAQRGQYATHRLEYYSERINYASTMATALIVNATQAQTAEMEASWGYRSASPFTDALLDQFTDTDRLVNFLEQVVTRHCADGEDDAPEASEDDHSACRGPIAEASAQTFDTDLLATSFELHYNLVEAVLFNMYQLALGDPLDLELRDALSVGYVDDPTLGREALAALDALGGRRVAVQTTDATEAALVSPGAPALAGLAFEHGRGTARQTWVAHRRARQIRNLANHAQQNIRNPIAQRTSRYTYRALRGLQRARILGPLMHSNFVQRALMRGVRAAAQRAGRMALRRAWTWMTTPGAGQALFVAGLVYLAIGGVDSVRGEFAEGIHRGAVEILDEQAAEFSDELAVAATEQHHLALAASYQWAINDALMASECQVASRLSDVVAEIAVTNELVLALLEEIRLPSRAPITRILTGQQVRVQLDSDCGQFGGERLDGWLVDMLQFNEDGEAHLINASELDEYHVRRLRSAHLATHTGVEITGELTGHVSVWQGGTEHAIPAECIRRIVARSGDLQGRTNTHHGDESDD